MTEVLLPAYVLAIFDEAGGAGDQGGGQGDSSAQGDTQGGASSGDSTASGNAGDRTSDAQRSGDHRAGDASNQRGAGQRDRANRPDDTTDRGASGGQSRDDSGRFEAGADRRIRELNDENATRRRENRELRSTVDTLSRRTIVGDAREALTSAGAINDRVVELFLQDQGDKVKIDAKTGVTTGLEAIADWKKSNPAFFKQDDAGSNGDTAANKDGSQGADDKGKGNDGKDGAQKRGNSSAAAGSQGSGSGASDDGTGGLPDLSKLTPAERKEAIARYKRGLSGAGARAGYGRATSKR